MASLVAQIKNLPAVQETRVRSLGWEDPLRRKWQPIPIFLPGEFHGQRSLVGYSPWGRKELDTTERLTQQLVIFEGDLTSFIMCLELSKAPVWLKGLIFA